MLESKVLVGIMTFALGRQTGARPLVGIIISNTSTFSKRYSSKFILTSRMLALNLKSHGVHYVRKSTTIAKSSSKSWKHEPVCLHKTTDVQVNLDLSMSSLLSEPTRANLHLLQT